MYIVRLCLHIAALVSVPVPPLVVNTTHCNCHRIQLFPPLNNTRHHSRFLVYQCASSSTIVTTLFSRSNELHTYPSFPSLSLSLSLSLHYLLVLSLFPSCKTTQPSLSGAPDQEKKAMSPASRSFKSRTGPSAAQQESSSNNNINNNNPNTGYNVVDPSSLGPPTITSDANLTGLVSRSL